MLLFPLSVFLSLCDLRVVRAVGRRGEKKKEEKRKRKGQLSSPSTIQGVGRVVSDRSRKREETTIIQGQEEHI
jgi:hypothetical protein